MKSPSLTKYLQAAKQMQCNIQITRAHSSKLQCPPCRKHSPPATHHPLLTTHHSPTTTQHPRPSPTTHHSPATTHTPYHPASSKLASDTFNALFHSTVPLPPRHRHLRSHPQPNAHDNIHSSSVPPLPSLLPISHPCTIDAASPSLVPSPLLQHPASTL